MRREIPGWLAVVVILLVLAVIIAAGWYFSRPRFSNLPIGETPTGEPIYQK